MQVMAGAAKFQHHEGISSEWFLRFVKIITRRDVHPTGSHKYLHFCSVVASTPCSPCFPEKLISIVFISIRKQGEGVAEAQLAQISYVLLARCNYPLRLVLATRYKSYKAQDTRDAGVLCRQNTHTRTRT